MLLISATAPGELASPPALSQREAGKGGVAILASGRGFPWGNLSDGFEIITDFVSGSGQTALHNAGGRPLALATGQFDGDGVPDLVSGYETAQGGLLVLHPGNRAAIFPKPAYGRYAPWNEDSPFLSPARVFTIPDPPTFLGSGDFDSDGDQDVVAGALDSKRLWLVPGTGGGGFEAPIAVELPGRIRTLITGEVNWRDGLEDVVVGIDGPDGPQVLVFERAQRALSGPPRTIDLPDVPTALALGKLDNDYLYDLAVASGSHLSIFGGVGRSSTPMSGPTQFPLDTAVLDMTVGDFSGDRVPDLALLYPDMTLEVLSGLSAPARHRRFRTVRGGAKRQRAAGEALLLPIRVSGQRPDDLLVVDRLERRLEIVVNQGGGRVPEEYRLSGGRWSVGLEAANEVVDVVAMRLNPDALSDLVVLKQGRNPLAVIQGSPQPEDLVVNLSTDENDADLQDGVCDIDEMTLELECTLYAAIQQANFNIGADRIVFETFAVNHVSNIVTVLNIFAGPVWSKKSAKPPILEVKVKLPPSLPGVPHDQGPQTDSILGPSDLFYVSSSRLLQPWVFSVPTRLGS